MSVYKNFTALTLGLCLSACASLISGPTQEITVNTPGASEARCSIDNGLRYPVEGGQTIRIMRSEKALIVDCYGSGNRHRRMRISPDGNEWAMLNVTNGIVPGLTYDHFAKGLYEYPDVVTIDFTGEPARGYDLPAYHDLDAPNPYDQPIENMGPTKAKLESDRYKTPAVVNKIDPKQNQINPAMLKPDQAQPALTPMETGTVPSSSSSAQPVLHGNTAEELTRSANPDVFDK